MFEEQTSQMVDERQVYLASTEGEARELGLRWEHLAEMRSKDVRITLIKGKGGLRWTRRGGGQGGGVSA
jgi:hypothetical protein